LSLDLVDAFNSNNFPGEEVKCQVDFTEGTSAKNPSKLVVIELCLRRFAISFEADLYLPLDIPYIASTSRSLFYFALTLSHLL
jgi:hypothetical protein